jgi:hypothetical protein
MVTDYGLIEIPEENLKVANTDETSFLRQGEIYSIYQGYEYGRGICLRLKIGNSSYEGYYYKPSGKPK